jgi:hypothetical protein
MPHEITSIVIVVIARQRLPWLDMWRLCVTTRAIDTGRGLFSVGLRIAGWWKAARWANFRGFGAGIQRLSVMQFRQEMRNMDPAP